MQLRLALEPGDGVPLLVAVHLGAQRLGFADPLLALADAVLQVDQLGLVDPAGFQLVLVPALAGGQLALAAGALFVHLAAQLRQALFQILDHLLPVGRGFQAGFLVLFGQLFQQPAVFGGQASQAFVQRAQLLAGFQAAFGQGGVQAVAEGGAFFAQTLVIVVAALQLGTGLHQAGVEVVQGRRLLGQLGFQGLLLVLCSLQVVLGQLQAGAQGGFVGGVLGGGQHGRVQAQAVDAVDRGIAQARLEIGALQQTGFDQLAQVLFPARLLATEKFQQGVLARVEQACRLLVFLFAFAHLAGGRLVLLGQILALAQQLALLLGEGLELLAGGLALLVGLFQASVEDVQAAAFLLAVAELVDALFVVLALQFAGMPLLAVAGFGFLAAVGEGLVQLAQGIVFLLGPGGQFVAHLAFLVV